MLQNIVQLLTSSSYKTNILPITLFALPLYADICIGIARAGRPIVFQGSNWGDDESNCERVSGREGAVGEGGRGTTFHRRDTHKIMIGKELFDVKLHEGNAVRMIYRLFIGRMCLSLHNLI